MFACLIGLLWLAIGFIDVVLCFWACSLPLSMSKNIPKWLQWSFLKEASFQIKSILMQTYNCLHANNICTSMWLIKISYMGINLAVECVISNTYPCWYTWPFFVLCFVFGWLVFILYFFPFPTQHVFCKISP